MALSGSQKTRLGLGAFPARLAGSFSGKPPNVSVGHPVGKITRLGLGAFPVQRAGSFAGKTSSGVAGPQKATRTSSWWISWTE